MRLLLSRGARRALQLGGPASDSLAERFRDARVLARKLEALLSPTAAPITAGDLHAFERLEQALRAFLDRFLSERDPDLLARSLAELDRRFGSRVVDRLLGSFEDDFLSGRSDSSPQDEQRLSRRRQELLCGLIVFSIAHANPAGADLAQVLHSGDLVDDVDYEPVVAALGDILDEVPGLDAGSASLLQELRRPIEAAPDSIGAQLRWIIEHWLELPPQVGRGLVAALDLISEEETPRFAPGPGPVQAPSFDHLETGDVHYGTDRDWMSSLVLVAKNTQVWLHQLSIRHGREITRLDQIPDAELATLAERGSTGLWLIGLWERSRASRKIKQLCGNPEAAGSAYSLVAYRIAPELGGQEALETLEEQAERFGIRLSADMVPNHTGIDSEWLIERPELFLSVEECPFPSYTFDGPDLSSDPRVGIYLEDHYFDRSDAAVVFRRLDRRSGEVRYVYHGNDGTGMPWNDTAQLDYLNPATREAVSGTILEVAKKFPIIRFDAAMTLAKQHIQRLWHPEPGSAGAIPSRAEHAMRRDEFDRRMPREFWRDVVDRAESETPGTLLLAEAFWLMEGYFVRNLGLHRVYNSAFMNMLRDHDNSGYRKLVRESLAFDPEILRRYVNFLSNPDEKTALEQFGNGDRYFGASVLLATMPGLPMFAHGQIEGLAERYGMEYRRAYVDEEPDPQSIERHEREIAPLLRERRRFAGIEGFAMHDFVSLLGTVDDGVLAFSHRDRDLCLVLFNNQPTPTLGFLQIDLDLDRSPASDRLCRFRDRTSGRYFLRPVAALRERGLELELGGYESAVLDQFQVLEATDEGGIYPRLFRHLGLRGTPSFEQAGRQLHLDDARSAFGEVLATLSVAAPLTPPALLAIEEQLEELDRHLQSALATGRSPAPHRPGEPADSPTPVVLATWLEAISRLAAVEQAFDWPRTERMLGALELLVGSEREKDARLLLPAFALLGYVRQRWGHPALVALEPGPATRTVLGRRELGAERGSRLATLVEIAALDGWLDQAPPPGRKRSQTLLEHATGSETAARILGYDRDSDTVDGGLFRQFLTWRATTSALSWLADPAAARQDSADAVVGWCDVLERLGQAVAQAEMRIAPVTARLAGIE